MRPRLPQFRTAILHQGGPAPAVGGVVKPFKPGGYTDSGSDLGNILLAQGEIVVTPTSQPSPTDDKSWTFPDTPAGIRAALDKGANVLYANTVLHKQHAIVSMRDELAKRGIRMVGQSPLKTEDVDDKAATNTWLAQQSGLQGSFPRARLMHEGYSESDLKAAWEYLVGEGKEAAVVKPIRGRGSHGVSVVYNLEDLGKAVQDLLKESNSIQLEEYCPGEEITVTVLPPGEYFDQGNKPKHWSLPVIRRVGHKDGIAPYSGLIPVTVNSHAVTAEEHKNDETYSNVQARCARIAELLGTTAPLRVDARRKAGASGEFVIFDVNMKPNMTGPGRPGREQQTALTGMAAQQIGWGYGDFVLNVVKQAQLVGELIPEQAK